MLKYINVFHISQVEGVEPLQKEELNDIEPIEKAENILKDYPNLQVVRIANNIFRVEVPPGAEDEFNVFIINAKFVCVFKIFVFPLYH